MRSVEEWIGKNDDTGIPPRVRVRVFDRSRGRCCVCTARIVAGGWQADHVLALANGGENRESNLQAICSACHRAKTKKDVAEKSKVARVRMKHLGIRKNSRQTFSSNRQSKLKKKISGEVVDRATGLPVSFGRTQ